MDGIITLTRNRRTVFNKKWPVLKHSTNCSPCLLTWQAVSAEMGCSPGTTGFHISWSRAKQLSRWAWNCADLINTHFRKPQTWLKKACSPEATDSFPRILTEGPGRLPGRLGSMARALGDSAKLQLALPEARAPFLLSFEFYEKFK
jgi:hypothetical protein